MCRNNLESLAIFKISYNIAYKILFTIQMFNVEISYNIAYKILFTILYYVADLLMEEFFTHRRTPDGHQTDTRQTTV